MKRERVIYLEDNMIDENEKIIFYADIPYIALGNLIINEDNLAVPIHDIWVNFRLVHQYIK